MKENDTKKVKTRGVSIRVFGGVVTLIAIVLAFVAFALASRIGNLQDEVAASRKQYLQCSEAIADLQMASDYLTTQARSFVVTGRREFLDAYVREIQVDDTRSKAVEVLRSSFSSDDAAAKELEQALEASNELAETELVAMKLAADHYKIQDLPDMVTKTDVSKVNADVASGSADDIAKSLLLNEDYNKAKQEIKDKVEQSSNALLEKLHEANDKNQKSLNTLLFALKVVVALLLCIVMVFVLALFMYVLKPLSNYVTRISAQKSLKPDGAYELHYLANAYNAMYEDNAKRIEQLRAFAERDPLTGISNRSGYDNFLATHTRDIVLLLIEIDEFADYNMVYGHDAGDEVLKRLADALVDAFRSTDFPCRIDSDMFAVIMTNMSTDLRDVIVSKVEMVNTILSNDSDDLPVVTLSVGAAFSTEGMSDKDIYNAAGSALMDAQQIESNSIVFYGESNSAS
ncbi:MAG: diguanylate cyclase [Atopobiaceae bacterium]|nr:diguanylate cyclase [Atopobiaceae bacterium]